MPVKRSKQAPALSAFISHAKADAKKAQEIAASLEERGLKCWIAPRDVKAGRSYGDEIIRGIESTRSFVLVLSKASNDSAFVAREVERAVSKKKPIFAVRIANVEPSPSLELFISGTQWIDAFGGKLGPHIDRLANLLGEEEGAPVTAAGDKDDAKPRQTPRWVWPAGAAASVLIAVGAGLALWPGQQTPDGPVAPNSLMTKPVWLPKPEAQPKEQMAAAEPSGDTEMIVGGKPAEASGADVARPASDPSAGDPDFRACEKSSGYEGIAACDRAIASGKFTGRMLSYLYSDRGFMRMQPGDLDGALVDLNKAAEIDSTNFYAFWNRGAVHVAQGDLESARSDFNRALALNPDQTSKVKIEEALNAVTGANAPQSQASDPSVISDPLVFGGHDEGTAADAAAYPAEAMPASPSVDPAPALPAAPPPGQ